MEGWIKLYRKLRDWQWYSNSCVKDVFIELLLIANHQDNMWMGTEVKRGSAVTSVSSLAEKLGFTTQQIRTALKKLESTGEINKQTTNRNTTVIVLNYDVYQSFTQSEMEGFNNQITNKQQTNNKQIITNNNVKNVKNDNNVRNEEGCSTLRPSIFDALYQLVMLSELQEQKLIELMGEDNTIVYINKLAFQLSKGKVYKSHYKTIVKWYTEDTEI